MSDEPTTAEITAAVQRAMRKAVWTHAQLGNPVAAWRDGQVVWLSPEEVHAQLATPAVNGPANPQVQDS